MPDPNTFHISSSFLGSRVARVWSGRGPGRAQSIRLPTHMRGTPPEAWADGSGVERLKVLGLVQSYRIQRK